MVNVGILLIIAISCLVSAHAAQLQPNSDGVATPKEQPSALAHPSVEPAPVNEPVYTEGGVILNNTSSSEDVPPTKHQSVKRILHVEEPAPVHETKDYVVLVTTAKNLVSASSMEKPQNVPNITSSSSTTMQPSSSTPTTTATTTTTKVLLTSTTTPATPAQPANVTVAAPVPSSEGTSTTLSPRINSTVIVSTSSSTSSPTTPRSTTKAPTTTTTTTAATTTTTTTTPKPMKPTITVSLNDDPSIVHEPAVKTVLPSAPLQHVPSIHNNLLVEEPIAQPSRENLFDDNTRVRHNRRDLVIPIVSLIFALPMLLGLMTIFVRKFRDYWHTRHYRRMDFLVDGIYND